MEAPPDPWRYPGFVSSPRSAAAGPSLGHSLTGLAASPPTDMAPSRPSSWGQCALRAFWDPGVWGLTSARLLLPQECLSSLCLSPRSRMLRKHPMMRGVGSPCPLLGRLCTQHWGWGVFHSGNGVSASQPSLALAFFWQNGDHRKLA